MPIWSRSERGKSRSMCEVLYATPSAYLLTRSMSTCVGALPQGYIHNTPLPRVPSGQSTKSHIQVTTIPDYYETPHVVPTYNSPRSIVESAAYAFSPAWHASAINT